MMENPIVRIEHESGLLVVYENNEVFAAINPTMISHVGLSEGRCKIFSVSSTTAHAIGLPKEAINDVIAIWKRYL